MRPGLVAAGAALLLLGAAVVVGVLLAPGATVDASSRHLSVRLPGGAGTRLFGWGLNGSSVLLAIAWTSSAPIAASLYASGGCHDGTCASGTLLASWSRNASGAWVASAPPAFPVVLVLDNLGNGTAQVAVGLTASAAVAASLPPWVELVTLVGGTALAAIGSLGVFLGLFLRSGVYPARSPPRAPPV